jgi:hypothetical protein
MDYIFSDTISTEERIDLLDDHMMDVEDAFITTISNSNLDEDTKLKLVRQICRAMGQIYSVTKKLQEEKNI